MKVWILRGLPGSGKSTLVSNWRTPASYVCSADTYHIVGGVYRFDPKNAANAHNECLKDFANIVANCGKIVDVFVDNTNTAVWEIAPYYRLAEALGHTVEIVYIHCDLKQAMSRGVHNVPAATMLAMQRRLLTEELPSFWKQTVIFA
jgi:predicted ABC-type ATPase